VDGRHEVLGTLRRDNRRCLEEAQKFQERTRQGRTTPKEHATIKKEFPYYGFVPCRAAGIDFVLFHAHDDVVAWKFLWYGDDAHQRAVVEKWVECARSARLVYDIGGYTGLMSVLAALANPSLQVHYVEPIERTADRATLNVRLNHVADRVAIHNVAASAAAGSVQFNMYRQDSFLGTGNSVYDKGLPIKSVREVERVTIDGLLPGQAPDLVKIDVEGHELEVLQGMAAAVEKGRPRMIVEVWEHDRDQVLGLLDSWGYRWTPFDLVESRVMDFFAEPEDV
jgi:FkbM family methyltransferase